MDLSFCSWGWDRADNLLLFCPRVLMALGYVESEVFNLVLAGLSLFLGYFVQSLP
jgi:hypothetical protein